MNTNDRLTVRSLMLDEVYADKIQMSHRLDALEEENKELKKELEELKPKEN